MSATYSNRHRLLEKYVEVVREDGLNTNKNVNIGVTGTPNLWVGGNVTVGGSLGGGGVVTLTAAATIALDPTTGNVFKDTPAQNQTINCATVPAQGEYISFVVTTSGTTSYTLTFGTNFKSTGTLATGTVTAKVFTVTFVSDGVNLNEVSRTTAM